MSITRNDNLPRHPGVTLRVTQVGAVITMIVRRDKRLPAQDRDSARDRQFSSTYVATYSTFEHLPRTKRNERLLQLPPHPGAFYVRLPAGAATAQGCKGFGGFESLTEKEREAMNPRLLALGCVALAATIAASPATPATRNDGPPISIAAIGDSISTGACTDSTCGNRFGQLLVDRYEPGRRQPLPPPARDLEERSAARPCFQRRERHLRDDGRPRSASPAGGRVQGPVRHDRAR